MTNSSLPEFQYSWQAYLEKEGSKKACTLLSLKPADGSEKDQRCSRPTRFGLEQRSGYENTLLGMKTLRFSSLDEHLLNSLDGRS